MAIKCKATAMAFKRLRTGLLRHVHLMLIEVEVDHMLIFCLNEFSENDERWR